MPVNVNNYTNGKVYRIVSFSTGKQYIGSTCDDLSKRMSKHGRDYRAWQEGKRSYITSFEILGHGDAEIYLIENVNCRSKDELHKREGEIIQVTDCVNKIKSGNGGKCSHDRPVSLCYECNGSQICNHGKEKHKCIECKGSQICEHNHQKAGCRECKGVSICPHNKFKYICVECKGTSICIHNKDKRCCKECEGVQTQQVLCECGMIMQRACLPRHRKTKIHRDFLTL